MSDKGSAIVAARLPDLRAPSRSRIGVRVIIVEQYHAQGTPLPQFLPSRRAADHLGKNIPRSEMKSAARLQIDFPVASSEKSSSVIDTVARLRNIGTVVTLQGSAPYGMEKENAAPSPGASFGTAQMRPR